MPEKTKKPKKTEKVEAKEESIENTGKSIEDSTPECTAEEKAAIKAALVANNSSAIDDGTPLSETAFSSLKEHKVSDRTLQAVENMGFTNMMEIQAKSIPVALAGKDILGAARTGSGKTVAFLLPVVELICSKLKFKKHNGTGALVIAPTRELACQIYETLEKLMDKHTPTYGLIIGGENRKVEVKKLEEGVNILVATPGRLLDHLQNTQNFLVKNLKCLVIDEADQVLNLGFEEDMKKNHSTTTKRTTNHAFLSYPN